MNLWGFQPEVIALMHESIARHDFDADSELQLSTFVGHVLENTSLVFEVLPTRSRCIGITHAKDLPVAQLLVRLEIESGHRPEHAFV
jgi:hypothetical protein